MAKLKNSGYLGKLAFDFFDKSQEFKKLLSCRKHPEAKNTGSRGAAPCGILRGRAPKPSESGVWGRA